MVKVELVGNPLRELQKWNGHSLITMIAANKTKNDMDFEEDDGAGTGVDKLMKPEMGDVDKDLFQRAMTAYNAGDSTESVPMIHVIIHRADSDELTMELGNQICELRRAETMIPVFAWTFSKCSAHVSHFASRLSLDVDELFDGKDETTQHAMFGYMILHNMGGILVSPFYVPNENFSLGSTLTACSNDGFVVGSKLHVVVAVKRPGHPVFQHAVLRRESGNTTLFGQTPVASNNNTIKFAVDQNTYLFDVVAQPPRPIQPEPEKPQRRNRANIADAVDSLNHVRNSKSEASQERSIIDDGDQPLLSNTTRYTMAIAGAGLAGYLTWLGLEKFWNIKDNNRVTPNIPPTSSRRRTTTRNRGSNPIPPRTSLRENFAGNGSGDAGPTGNNENRNYIRTSSLGLSGSSSNQTNKHGSGSAPSSRSKHQGSSSAKRPHHLRS